MNVKRILIQDILSVKEEAIKMGFDWPTQNIEEADINQLEDFIEELSDFLNRS